MGARTRNGNSLRGDSLILQNADAGIQKEVIGEEGGGRREEGGKCSVGRAGVVWRGGGGGVLMAFRVTTEGIELLMRRGHGDGSRKGKERVFQNKGTGK